MSKRYVVKPLGEGQVMQAYPLVQTAVPHLTLDQWMSYARSLCAPQPSPAAGHGVMSAQNGNGYIYGIYCHEIETDIHHGRVLKVSNLFAANLYDSEGIVDGLMDSMHAVARDSGCNAVHVDLPESMRPAGPRPAEGVLSRFKGAGYRVESVALCRKLESE